MLYTRQPKPELRLAHVTNAVAVGPSSDLQVAQPVTFETWRAAYRFAVVYNPAIQIMQAVTALPADCSALPEGFIHLPLLERHTAQQTRFEHLRQLPFLGDILTRATTHLEADWYIYSNVDIALQPYFYVAIRELLENSCLRAVIINRRTIPKEITRPARAWAELGTDHPGFDCFVWHRSLVEQLWVADVCLGVDWVGRALALSLFALDEKQVLYLPAHHLTYHLGDDRTWQNPVNRPLVDHNFQQMNQVLQKVLENYPALTHPQARRIRYAVELERRNRQLPYDERWLAEYEAYHFGKRPSLLKRIYRRLQRISEW